MGKVDIVNLRLPTKRGWSTLAGNCSRDFGFDRTVVNKKELVIFLLFIEAKNAI